MGCDYKAHLILEGFPPHRVEKFLAWHRKVPHVWQRFEARALELARAGQRNWGSMAVMNDLRWRENFVGGEDFKVDHNWAPFYARIFAIKHPEFRDFFKTHKVGGTRNGVT